jgi:hypothetical protein
LFSFVTFENDESEDNSGAAKETSPDTESPIVLQPCVSPNDLPHSVDQFFNCRPIVRKALFSASLLL